MITSHGLSHIVCLAVVSVLWQTAFQKLRHWSLFWQFLRMFKLHAMSVVRFHVMLLYEMVCDRRFRLWSSMRWLKCCHVYPKIKCIIQITHEKKRAVSLPSIWSRSLSQFRLVLTGLISVFILQLRSTSRLLSEFADFSMFLVGKTRFWELLTSQSLEHDMHLISLHQ